MPTQIQEVPRLIAQDNSVDLEELWENLILRVFCTQMVHQHVSQVRTEWRGATPSFTAAQLRAEATVWRRYYSTGSKFPLLDAAFDGAWEWLLMVAPVGLDSISNSRLFAERAADDIVRLVNKAAGALEN